MAKKNTLTVASEFGTFTRTTARTYTHFVVVKGYRAELLEAARLEGIKSAQKQVAHYRKVLETGKSEDERAGRAGEFDRKITAEYLADGSYARWVEQEEARAAALTARGPVTQDANSWSLDVDTEPKWGVLGWAGRFDLACKLADSADAKRYRHVAIVEVATGKTEAQR